MPVAVFAVAVVYVVLFWRLGVPTFWDPDEAHYAETSREMVASGDWLAPYYNEQPFFDKPALFHQLQGVAMLLVGPTELGARIVPALAALALIILTAWFGWRVASWRVGLVAALLLAVSPGVFALARYAILDTVFTAFVFGGSALLAVSALCDRPRLQWAGYVLIALAVLTKGPLALALCGLTFIVACTASADLRRRLLALRWVSGAALILAISAPWFIYMYLRFRPDFVNGYLLDENVRLFASSRFANQPGVWFYFQILATGLLPWTGLLVGRLFDDVAALFRRDRLDSLEILLWIWSAVVVGFFTASSFRLDHYIFPAAPALCLLCARAWSDLYVDPMDRRHAGVRVGAHLVGPLLVVIGISGGYFLVARLDLPVAAIIVPVLITACGVVLTIFVNIRGRDGGRPLQLPWFGLTALVVAYAGLMMFVIPALEQRKVVPQIAEYVRSRLGERDRVATYRLNRWSPVLRFYVNRHTTFLESPDEARVFFMGSDPFYCVMLRRSYDEFVAQGAPLRIVYERNGMWATSGRALWRRRIPPAEFVVTVRAQ